MIQAVKIYLENGLVLEGASEAEKDLLVFGELVFTTSMTGYQEAITDPSFAGQILVMSYPLIGNYGIQEKFSQADTIYAKGVVVHNVDHNGAYVEFLNQHKIPLVIFDTRRLIHLIRDSFYPKCVMSTKNLTKDELDVYYKMIDTNVVDKISVKTPSIIKGFAENGKKIGILDFGMKLGIASKLKKYFSEVVILPHSTGCEEILSMGFSCLLLSNGPGDPAALEDEITNIRKLFGKIDIYGICLGHQLLALALGCKTQVMKFGHRGANHPVINVKTGKIIITSQNHGYEIVEGSLGDDVCVTHRNIHDNSIEGIKSLKYNVQSVQFHPEASPGPDDGAEIFDGWFDKFIL